MHKHKPRSSKGKRNPLLPAGPIVLAGCLLFWSAPAMTGEIVLESGENQDTILGVTPGKVSPDRGTMVLQSGEGEDTIMEVHPPESNPDLEQEQPPILVIPEVRIRGGRP